ncbi:thioesterase family protein [Nocardioides currus]|uniref:TesB-like acyl-CoA thioesterase 3 n=1 Tax=Nocardioides currus TaxID=2133958 RepID=A0A2R7YSX3_9ACTN|nr:thioesterase family protein [Nocardioides currus]PUA79403.1 TesB-like acyl-CoA thioesterase 3 [Nocardioides currus]
MTASGARSEWDDHIAVTPSGDGDFTADLSDGWVVGGGVNGGYLLATVGNALGQVVPGKPDPIAVSAYYLSASVPGPATISIRVVRDGGSVATLAADLVQGDPVHGEQARITVLATYGDLDRLPDDVGTTATPPPIAPREQCVSNSMAPPEVRRVARLMERFEMLFDPGCIGWAVGKPDGNGALQAWFRLNGERDPDPVELLMVLDALPPVTFDLGMPGWAPTLELTAHVRAKPAPGWLRVSHRTRNLAGGMFEEDCEVWDSADRLVAQSRQLARQPRPVAG